MLLMIIFILRALIGIVTDLKVGLKDGTIMGSYRMISSVLNSLYVIENAIRHHKQCEGVANDKELDANIDIIKQYIKGQRALVWAREKR